MSAAGVDLTSLRDRFMAAQLKGDRREALRLVIDEGLNRGASVRDVQLGVIQEAQRTIGHLWQENAVTIAQEHLATAISHIALSHLYAHAEQQPANGRKVVVACVEGELHDLPARLVSDALELAGFEVRFLGASVPVDSLVRMVNEERPDLVALSTTMPFNVPALRTAVARLRRDGPKGLAIAVGGAACEWIAGTAKEVGADATGCDAEEVVAAAETLLGVER
jgi:methanogenic corrinoid protein MtbC1